MNYLLLEIPTFVKNELTFRNNREVLQNPKSPWIRFTSNFNDGKILMGGDLNLDQRLKFGFDEMYRSDGIPPYRPIPGVNSVSISEEGSILTASISWQCHSVDQLNEFSPYFLNPGMTAIIEFGWSNCPPDAIVDISDVEEIRKLFYNKLNGSPFYNILQHPRFKAMRKAGGRYGAVVGMISDFNFSANTDGGFDCTTEVTSYGEAALAMSSYSHLVRREETRPAVDRVKKTISEYMKQDFDTEVASNSPGPRNSPTIVTTTGASPVTLLNTSGDYIHYVPWAFVEERIINYHAKMVSDDEAHSAGELATADTVISYFPGLKSIDPYTAVILPPGASSEYDFISFDKKPEKSLMGEGVIFGANQGNNQQYADSDYFDSPAIQQLQYNQYNKRASEDRDVELDGEAKERQGWLHNLYINAEIIKEAFLEENELKDVIQAILNKCSEAFMNVWNFKVDLSEGLITVIDRNCPVQDTVDDHLSRDDTYSFFPYTTQNILRDISFSTDMSENIKGQMMMSSFMKSQTGLEKDAAYNNPSDATSRLYKAYEGEDRILGKKMDRITKPSLYSDTGRPKENSNFSDTITSAKQQENAEQVASSNGIEQSSDSMNQYPDSARKFLREYGNELVLSMDEYPKVRSDLMNDVHPRSPLNSNKLLHISVDLTLDGISGLYRHQVFKMDYLPHIYTKYGMWVITSVSHDISGDDWTTSVSARFICQNLLALDEDRQRVRSGAVRRTLSTNNNMSPDEYNRRFDPDDDGYAMPLNGTITSDYGERRSYGPHEGIDIDGQIGDPIRAAGRGTVTRADTVDNSNAGKWVEITHDDGKRTRYMHMDQVLVQDGQRVEAGQLIGTVGNTGSARPLPGASGDGSHLHYEIIGEDGSPINPIDFHGI